jgi:transposase
MRSPRTRSPNYPDSSWRTHAENWNHSDLSAPAYAAQHGLHAHNLYAWRQRLRAEQSAPAAATPSHGVRLVPLNVEAPSRCELTFADGRCLRFPAHIDPKTLAMLLRTVSAS